MTRKTRKTTMTKKMNEATKAESVDLAQVPLSELHAELQRRRLESLRVENARRAAQRQRLLTNVDQLLPFTEHVDDRCSDEKRRGYAHASDGEVECARCQLLALKQDDWNLDWGVELRFVPIPEREVS